MCIHTALVSPFHHILTYHDIHYDILTCFFQQLEDRDMKGELKFFLFSQRGMFFKNTHLLH